MGEYYRELMTKYEERIDKALEYIEERVKYKVEPFYLSIAQTNILYKILQGSDENETK